MATSAKGKAIKNATEKVWVLASPELLAQMLNRWSPAVKVKAERMADGRWEMTFRAAYDQRGNVIAFGPEFAVNPEGVAKP